MKQLKKFPGYFVTENGKIFSAWNKQNIVNEKGIIIDVKHYIDYSNLKEIKQSNSSNGYLKVGLRLNKKSYSRNVHRLVAETYIHNPENKKQVNHIDEDKTNNHVSNLEWVTPKENSHHSNCKYVWTVEHIESGTIWKVKSLKEFCDKNNLHRSHLYETENLKKSKQHKGFRIIKKEGG